jgi:hypothetical protein
MVVNATWRELETAPPGEAIGFVMLGRQMFTLYEHKGLGTFTAVHRPEGLPAQALFADYWDAEERGITLATVMGALIARVEQVAI